MTRQQLEEEITALHREKGEVTEQQNLTNLLNTLRIREIFIRNQKAYIYIYEVFFWELVFKYVQHQK
jgi:hypothetical protein